MKKRNQKPVTSNQKIWYEKRAKRKGYKIIAGIDEAGVGPWAGPVVAAAVVLGGFSFSARIDDSKKLTPRQRIKALQEIKKKSRIGIGIVGQRQIDDINILNAAKLAMKKAILDLDVEPDYLLIDGRIKLGGYHDSESIISGDSKSLSIACASIVAKVSRDRIMEKYAKIYKGYGFDKHKGYGTPQHIRALNKYGPCPIHRFSYKPISTLTSTLT